MQKEFREEAEGCEQDMHALKVFLLLIKHRSVTFKEV
jgi:hypothetical protein